MSNPQAYVRRTAANLAVSSVRRRIAEAAAVLRLSGQRQPLAELEAPDDEFWRAVRALPRRQAQVVALRYVYDAPIAEVAHVLDLAEGTVKSHLHRARSTLCEVLGLHDDISRTEPVA